MLFFPVLVARWDGGKVEVCVKRDQAGRKRRDEWDDEYDRGKVRIVEDHTGVLTPASYCIKCSLFKYFPNLLPLSR